jgi:hypothetical protein
MRFRTKIATLIVVTIVVVSGAVEPSRGGIQLTTGNLFEMMVDYGQGEPNKLGFIRYYNSFSQSLAPIATLGTRWRSNYDRALVVLPDSKGIAAERDTGRVLNFRVRDGVGIPDTDVLIKLIQTGDHWVLTDEDGTVETYGALYDPDRVSNSCGGMSRRGPVGWEPISGRLIKPGYGCSP